MTAAEFAEELASQPDHRFSRLSREEVARMQRRYEQAKRMVAYLDEVRRRATDAIVAGPGFTGGLTPEVECALDAEAMVAGFGRCSCGEADGQPWPSVPVPAYEKPIKRWAGGPVELNNWYWDRNSF